MAGVLIIGEEPDSIAPEDHPPGVTSASIRRGLTTARDALRAEGHHAEILYTTTAEAIGNELAEAVASTSYDVLVIGAGLRVLRPMLPSFERLMNAIRVHAPRSRLAFNGSPEDTADAARRQLPPE
jgi:hypothetical protein